MSFSNLSWQPLFWPLAWEKKQRWIKHHVIGSLILWSEQSLPVGTWGVGALVTAWGSLRPNMNTTRHQIIMHDCYKYKIQNMWSAMCRHVSPFTSRNSRFLKIIVYVFPVPCACSQQTLDVDSVVCLMLDQRRRRWDNRKQTLSQRLVLAVLWESRWMKEIINSIGEYMRSLQTCPKVGWSRTIHEWENPFPWPFSGQCSDWAN